MSLVDCVMLCFAIGFRNMGRFSDNGDIFMKFVAAIMHDKFFILIRQIFFDRRRRFRLRIIANSTIIGVHDGTFIEFTFSDVVVVLDGGISSFFFFCFLFHFL